MMKEIISINISFQSFVKEFESVDIFSGHHKKCPRSYVTARHNVFGVFSWWRRRAALCASRPGTWGARPAWEAAAAAGAAGGGGPARRKPC